MWAVLIWPQVLVGLVLRIFRNVCKMHYTDVCQILNCVLVQQILFWLLNNLHVQQLYWQLNDINIDVEGSEYNRLDTFNITCLCSSR